MRPRVRERKKRERESVIGVLRFPVRLVMQFDAFRDISCSIRFDHFGVFDPVSHVHNALCCLKNGSVQTVQYVESQTTRIDSRRGWNRSYGKASPSSRALLETGTCQVDRIIETVERSRFQSMGKPSRHPSARFNLIGGNRQDASALSSICLLINC